MSWEREAGEPPWPPSSAQNDAAAAARAEASRENSGYLPGVRLADNIHFQGDTAGLENAELVLIAVPSKHFRTVCENFLPRIPKKALVVLATKGIEQGTLLTMSQVFASVAKEKGIAPEPPFRLATLSGPSHAEEVGRRLLTTVVTAGSSLQDAVDCQQAFNRAWFRVYTSEDHLGVELGGSLKNIIALASGIADGLGLGDNAKAALMTRGLAEITRLGVAMGAKPPTFAGLAGMGDLVVTCMSRYSRNRSVGERLGRGEKWEEIHKGMKQVAEGVNTVVSARELGRRHGVEMPIVDQVYQVLFENKDASQAMRELMARELKIEG